MPRHRHWAEAVARRFLERRALRFVEANYHCRRGEIDLVMHHPGGPDGPDSAGGLWVFVEVRQRADVRHGRPAETITRMKLRRLRLAAQHYAARRLRTPDPPMRLDAVLLTGPRGRCGIEHLEDIGWQLE